MQTAAGPHYVIPRMVQPATTQPALVPPPTPDTMRHGPLPCLPPRHLPPYTSTSTIGSPDMTTPSHVGSSRAGTTQTPYAESPNLAAPVTAVGALVGMTQQQQQHLQGQYQYRPDSALPLPPPRHGAQPDWDETREDVEALQLQYQKLHDSMDLPPKERYAAAAASGRGMDFSIESDASSFMYSPIRGDLGRKSRYRTGGAGGAGHDDTQSFDSQLGLVENNKWSKAGYNFDPIDDCPEQEIVMMDQLTNVSAISQSTLANESLESSNQPGVMARNHETSSSNGNSNSNSNNTDTGGYDYLVGDDGDEQMDDLLMMRKRTNQREAKERLLLNSIERLRDDAKLVSELETMHEGDDENNEDDALSNLFTKIDLDKDGLLTGYDEKKRMRLSRFVQSLLEEMDTARPEEFFLSPTQIPGIAETHDDLQNALTFLLSMIQLADLSADRNWRCKVEMRAAMGIASSPKSPETLRGGDTSLFSLPSATTTPHTSNVSLATSITTRVSPRYESPPKWTEQGRTVRRAIEITSTLVQNMSEACEKLLETDRPGSDKAIRATEAIKRTYLQLMAVARSDLEALVQSFFYNGAPTAIVRQVSHEDGEHNTHRHPEHFQEYQSHLMATSNGTCQRPRHLLFAFDGQGGRNTTNEVNKHTNTSNLVEDDRYDDIDGGNQGNHDQYEELEDENGEDLRRQVGSNDYDTNDVRDGPDEREGVDEEVLDFYCQDTSAMPTIPCNQ